MTEWNIKRKCKNPKFKVIVCCQGHPSYYYHRTLLGALVCYAKQYIKKHKYGTMRFDVREVFE